MAQMAQIVPITQMEVNDDGIKTNVTVLRNRLVHLLADAEAISISTRNNQAAFDGKLSLEKRKIASLETGVDVRKKATTEMHKDEAKGKKHRKGTSDATTSSSLIVDYDVIDEFLASKTAIFVLQK